MRTQFLFIKYFSKNIYFLSNIMSDKENCRFIHFKRKIHGENCKIIVRFYRHQTFRLDMEASESKLVNPILNIIGVNSLRVGDPHITPI